MLYLAAPRLGPGANERGSTARGVWLQGFGRMLVTAAVLALFGLAGCSQLPGIGPSRSDINAAATAKDGPRFGLIDVDTRVVGVMERWKPATLKERFGDQRPVGRQLIGAGDALQITIWEASGGGLFSAPVTDRAGPGARTASIPEQVVGRDGTITVPYVDRRVVALGRTPQEVEAAIVEGLTGKAIQPQALVTLTRNVSNTATVIGEVTQGARVPLSPGGDRLLEVLAQSGGVRAPTYDISLALLRRGRVERVSMTSVLANPRENNIYIMPGDVITATRDPQTFTAVGATNRNAVVPFEAAQLSLEEAIAKAGGLIDQRSDPEGVFIIRYEPQGQFNEFGFTAPGPDLGGQVPVVYRVNMRDPQALLMARRFPIRSKDILYVSNAPISELNKVLSIIQGFVLPTAGLVTVYAVR